MKFVLGAVAAALMVGAVFAQPAEARCFWNGFQTVCVHHQWRSFSRPYWHHHHYRDYYMYR